MTSLAREEAERASAVKTHFLRLVSHELRTPLTTLHLQLQRLPRDAAAPARRSTSGRSSASGSLAATRLTGIVEALLHEAQIAQRAARGGGRGRGSRVRSSRKVVGERIARRREDKGLALRLRAPRARALGRRPSRASSSSSSRTSSGTPSSSPPRASSRSRSRAAATSSAWTSPTPGRASPPRIRRALFEPFERGARAAEQFVPGLGLGLAVVRDLAAAIGARVELASAPGAGSTFTVVLPRRQPEAARGVLSRSRGRGEGSQGSAGAGHEKRS